MRRGRARAVDRRVPPGARDGAPQPAPDPRGDRLAARERGEVAPHPGPAALGGGWLFPRGPAASGPTGRRRQGRPQRGICGATRVRRLAARAAATARRPAWLPLAALLVTFLTRIPPWIVADRGCASPALGEFIGRLGARPASRPRATRRAGRRSVVALPQPPSRRAPLGQAARMARRHPPARYENTARSFLAGWDEGSGDRQAGRRLKAATPSRLVRWGPGSGTRVPPGASPG